MQPSSAAVRRVRTWVRGALRLEAGRSWTPEPAGEPASELVEAVRRHRVVELVGSHADALGLSGSVAAEIGELRSVARRRLMVQLLEIERLTGLFGQAELPCLVFKGPALAMQTAGDPTARGAGDIDLLVGPAGVEAAFHLLEANGWRMRVGSEVRPGNWAWSHVLRTSNAFTFDGPGSTVDLHWRLDPTLDALPGFAELWERREPVNLGSTEVLALGRADLLAHTSLHAAKDNWRWLRSLVDVHRLAVDPQTWQRSFDVEPLRRLEVDTLAVTRFVVGLPPGVPAHVLAQVDRVRASVLTRALAAQERSVYAKYPFPGVESGRSLRYMLTASPTARDWRHAALSTVIPAKAVEGVDARTAWTGVPQALWNRLRRLRRRSLAWARREPGAGVTDSLVRNPR